MIVIGSKHFSGVNVHCFKPVLEAIVDLQELAGKETCEFPDFPQALVDILPGLKEHVCGLDRAGGFWLRLQEGTYFGHVVEHTAIELLNLAGYQSSYGKTRVVDDRVYRIVIQCHWPKTALLSLEMAIALVEDVQRGLSYSPDITRLRRQLEQERPGPSTQAIIDAVRSRGIPVSVLGHGSLIRLGTGVYRQYIEATVTGNTSCIGVDIACDKILTKKVLANALIPIPWGQVARDEEMAVEIARQMDVMVVLKPYNGNQGKGVSLNLASELQVRSAYKVAENYSSKVLVEEQIFGRHYRVLVVDNKVVAASERFPARITGDGINTIKDLIEIENNNPLRGEEHEKPLTRIKVDQIVFNVLARQNLTMNYVPAQGQVIDLRDNANLSTGGTAADVTDIVHPENAMLACRTARLLCLDIAGIDIVTEDISQPLLVGKGAVIEVNAAPGIRMHLFPTEGKQRPVGDAIAEYLFPPEKPHCIPIISVTGTNGKTTTARLAAHVLRQSGRRVGLACTDGVYIDGICVNAGDNTGPAAADAVLSDPAVEIAVLETARGGLLRRGLGYTEAEVAVVTNIAEDHLGCDGIETLEELCHVKSLVVETVKVDGFAVLNADDPRVVAMAPCCPGKVVYFSCQAKNNVLLRHLAAGGRGVMLEEGNICLVAGTEIEVLADVSILPITFQGAAQHNVANCLAAAAALWAAGVSGKAISQGLRDFDGNRDNPGRANYHDYGSFKLLLDYGHNYAGFESAIKLLNAIQPTGRKVGVIGMPGDRKDEDIIASGRLCGFGLDVIYIKEDKDRRGREPGQVASLLIKGIENSRSTPLVTVIHDELEALKAAVKAHQPGDYIVIFYENIAPIQQYIKTLSGPGKEAGIYLSK